MSKYTWKSDVSTNHHHTDGSEKQPLLSSSSTNKDYQNGNDYHVDVHNNNNNDDDDDDDGDHRSIDSHPRSNGNKSQRERRDTWSNQEPRLHQQEFESMEQERSYQERDKGERITPYDRLPTSRKKAVNQKQKYARIISSSTYFLASISVIIESVMNYICVNNGCEKHLSTGEYTVNFWWVAVWVGCATGFLFAVGSIAHVVADRIDVEMEGGLTHSRYDSLLAIISSWLTVVGAIGFFFGSIFEAMNGPNNDSGVYLLTGRILTVVGISFFFIGLLIERASVQMKLIDVIEAGRHDERNAVLWSIAATMIFCQFEVLFLVGSIVDIYESPQLTKLGHILWIVSGVGAVAGSMFEFISNVKEKP